MIIRTITFLKNSRSRLSDQNRINVTAHTDDILSFGGGIGQRISGLSAVGARMDLGAEVPKSMFDFLRDMDQQDTVDYQNMDHLIAWKNLEQLLYRAGTGLCLPQ